MKLLKWPLVGVHSVLYLPPGTKVIEVATQHNDPTLWTLGPSFDPGTVNESRTFVLFATGEEVSEGHEYIGTCHGIDGWMVFHIFEKVST